MKPTLLQFNFRKVLSIAIVLATTTAALAQPADLPQPIQFENVPITTAIQSLAGLAKINYLLDPKYTNSFVKPDGSMVPDPTITTNWTDLTAKQALGIVLTEHGLYLVEDPVTTIAEITVTNRITNPVDASLLGTDTNQIVPIVFQDVPLDEALKFLIQKTQANVTLDPKLSDSFDPITHRVVQLPMVSVRWESVTTRQAIVAICENYNLTIVKEPATGGVQIKRKE